VGVLSRPVRVGAVAVSALAITAFTGALASAGAATASPSAGQGFVALAGSVAPTTDTITGSYTNSKMQIEVAVAPRDAAGLNSELGALYDQNSPQYHRWLTTGQFDDRYAPTPAARQAVAKFLGGSGLKIVPSGSPFLVRATGTSAQVSSTFHTSLSMFKDPKGTKYFANSTPVYLPSSIAGAALGVIGLTNTQRDTQNAVHVRHFNNTFRSGAKASSASNCETPYPTVQQLISERVGGNALNLGYGAGPGCSGLTPSQENSIYGAPSRGASAKGKGVNIAVFELSAYQHSDIATWAHQFYGARYTPPLVDVTVDGGPLAPICPSGDQCPPQFEGYSGDIEVDADIENQLAVAPDVKALTVYNAPNDFTGQTELDEWSAIAKANQADVISSSWAICENDAGAAYVQAENTIFRQMAAQGQSVFGGSGDTGAFGCIRSDGTTIPNLIDPPSQPYVTAVGGTSFETFNPGTNPHPRYPATGEAVWNPHNLCSNAAPGPANDNQGGFFWCAAVGASGGGSSEFWGMPAYQKGPGVINANTTVGNGTTHCSLAATGTPCREVPDISADADEYTPYSEYCTGNASTPNSVCGTFSASQPVPGWFGIGGTSLSSPLVSAVFADRDSFTHHRTGNANQLIYQLYRFAPSFYFHDVTAAGHFATNNGLYPAVPGFDLATGVGTPKMAQLITGLF
jgi:subtilase family serine protease